MDAEQYLEKLGGIGIPLVSNQGTSNDLATPIQTACLRNDDKDTSAIQVLIDALPKPENTNKHKILSNETPSNTPVLS